MCGHCGVGHRDRSRVAGPPDADASATKPNEETANSICQFEGAHVPNLRLATSFSDDTLTWVTSGKTRYVFNTQSKRIEMALYADNLDSNEKVSITREEAEAIATEFARSIAKTFRFSLCTGVN